MKLTKLSVAALVFAGVVSSSNAANNTNSGEVHFKGSVVDTPCNLAPGKDGERVEVDFGQLSQAWLNANTANKATQTFSINLENCTFGDPATKNTASITFKGQQLGATTNVLSTTGSAQNLGISITPFGATAPVTLGTAYDFPTKLSNGHSSLDFTAQAYKAGAADVTAGTFEAISQFEIAYK